MAERPPAGGEPSPKRIREYVRTGGAFCPWCGNNEALHPLDHPVHVGSEFTYPVEHHLRCLACGREWTDLYQLVTVQFERKH